MEPCLIIVSRDRPDLLESLASLYRHEGEVEILLDRRLQRAASPVTLRADRRSPPPSVTDLRLQGFVVVPRFQVECQA
jgi:hypothetical protein